jgi:chemotaxis protein CheC
MRLGFDEKLAIIAKEAVNNASKAMVKLTGEMLAMNTVKIEIVEAGKDTHEFSPESLVFGVYLPVIGGLHGTASLIFSEKQAYNLCDLLYKRSASGKRVLSELDESALKEVGNIVCGSFLTIFANILKIKIIEGIPSLSFGRADVVANRAIINNIASKKSKGLAVKIKFNFICADVESYALFIFMYEEMEAVIAAMGG